MSGLKEALSAVPSTPRVLGLDFVKESAFIKGRPFLQTVAYTQALKGGEINFSFAEHASGIVAYRERRRGPGPRDSNGLPKGRKGRISAISIMSLSTGIPASIKPWPG